MINKKNEAVPHLIKAKLVSSWEEGTVHTHCYLDTESMTIVAREEVDCNYETLLQEQISVLLEKNAITLEVVDGDISNNGRWVLSNLLANTKKSSYDASH